MHPLLPRSVSSLFSFVVPGEYVFKLSVTTSRLMTLNPFSATRPVIKSSNTATLLSNERPALFYTKMAALCPCLLSCCAKRPAFKERKYKSIKPVTKDMRFKKATQFTSFRCISNFVTVLLTGENAETSARAQSNGHRCYY